MKRILYISFWSFLCVGILVLAGFAAAEEKNVVCNEVEINILRNGENYLVEEEDIRSLIRENGDSLIGVPLGEIHVTRLEQLVNKNPWVENAEVYAGINGKIRFDIIQREPLARIINGTGETYYLDKAGKLMLWSPSFTPRVLLVNGNIGETFHTHSVTDFSGSEILLNTTVLDEVYHLSTYLMKDSLWNAQFEQVYVNGEKEFELIPRAGDHRILFGDTNNMHEKLEKLRIFYTEGLNHTGWNQYDTINLKFKNQVVCSKIE